MSYGKVLVVYYSRSGRTRKVAKAFADKYNAVSEEIVEKVNRKGILGLIKSGRDSVKGKATEIGVCKNNPSDYDLVIIGSPVWASRITPAVRSYIKLYKASFKNVAFFCTEGGNGAEKVMENMADLCGLSPEFKYEFTNKDLKDMTYINLINSK
jgi:flavodoxin